MGKGDVKSIRLEEDHEIYIQQYRGDNFNNKLENLIADSIDFEKARTKRISQLDQLISQKKQQLENLRTKYSNLSEGYDALDGSCDLMTGIVSEIVDKVCKNITLCIQQNN